MTLRLAGSLWSVPEDEQAAALSRAAAAGLRVVHWDHTDGRFAAAGGFSPERAGALMAAVPDLRAEAHLMMVDALPVLDAFAEVCERVVVHAESATLHAALRRIERRGREPAVAVMLDTDLTTWRSQEVPLLVMSITPGRAGSRFDRAALDRIAAVRAAAVRDTAGRSRAIGVDGGVDADSAGEAIRHGADWIVSGTALFGAPDPGAWLRGLPRPAHERDLVVATEADPGQVGE